MTLSITNLFEESYYLANNPDVAAAVQAGQFNSGFQHFIQYGQFVLSSKPSRAPSPLFDEVFYLANNPDVAASVQAGEIGSGFQHFIQYGQFVLGSKPSRSPSPLFDEAFYLANNPDVVAAVSRGDLSSGYEHFVRYGQFAVDTNYNRNPSKLYDERFYLEHNPDVLAALGRGEIESGFRHYVLYGQKAGRVAVNTPPVVGADSFTISEDTLNAITPNLLANDSDRDGDVLVIARFSNPAHGSLTNNNNGTFSYTPNLNYEGTDSFTYTVNDNYGGLVSNTVTITVTAVNDAPVVGNDAVTLNQDTTAIISFANLIANDSDIEGDPLTVTGVSRQPINGTLTSNNGLFSYSPQAGFFGSDSFVYTVSDGQGGTSAATVNLTVNVVNSPPVAANDFLTINEDTPGTINVLGNDTDDDRNPLTVTSFSQPTRGSVTNNNGTLTYTPNLNSNGTDSFTYIINDGRTGTSSATVNITVNPVNDSPIALNDAITTNEDTPFAFTFTNLIANDTDPDGEQIFLNGFTQPSRGSVVNNGNGSFTYNPGPNFNGTDSFTYSIRDSAGSSTTATVRLTVNSINDIPVATNDVVSATEDTALVISTATLLANDSDADGDPKIITGFTQAINGRVADNGNGFLTYTPSSNFSGSDSFTYTITDGRGATASATVNVAVAPVNDGPPVPGADGVTTNEDTAVLISSTTFLANDTDPDPGDILSITSVGSPSRGLLTNNNNGTFTYTPNTNINGTDSFTYVVSDGNGGTALGVVNLTINSVNDGPPVANSDSVTTDEDTATASFNVLANDTDTEGDPITLLSNTQPTNGSLTGTGDGTFVYTPRANFNGSDSFSYIISDGNGGSASTTVRIIVNSVQDPLVANNDAIATNEDTPFSFSSNFLTANDNDGDGDPFSISTFSQPGQGSLSRNGTGTFTYTPNANFNGTDSFTYTIRDNANGGTASATVNIVVNSTNDAPIAVNDAIATNEDTPTLITIAPTLLGNDSDPDGDSLFITGFAQPSRGSLVDQGDGTYFYTPNPNVSGTDSFSYTISDGRGGTATGVANITIAPVNDAPTARNDAYTVNEDIRLSVTAVNGVLRNDTDIDGDRLIVSVSDTNSVQGGTVVVNNNGSFTYQAPTDFSGTDSFTYTVADPSGDTSSATVIVTVNPINDRPTATPDAVITNEEETVTIDLTDNVSDVDGDVLTFATATNPRNGVVANNGDGTFTYTPNVDFSGSDSFTYTVNDGRGGTATSTVSITVDNVNDIPVARNDSFTTTEDPGSVTIPNVLANDTDVDRGDLLSVSSNTDPTNGTLVNNGNGTFSYTPTTDFNGTDSFTYVVDDGKGGTAEATVLLRVTPLNDAPTATAEDVSTAEETAIAINLLDNASDVDGDPLTFSVGANPRNGTVVNNNNGVFTYTPRLNFVGSDSFTYRVNDGRGGTAFATVGITVGDVNDSPIARNDSFTGNEDTEFTFSVIANDTDIESDPLTVTEFTEAANGTLTNNNGTFTYQANENFNGSDSFTYVIDDGRGGTATASVNLIIRPVNDAPVANSDELVTNEDTLGNVNVLFNDSDVDNDTFSVLSFTPATRGTVRNLGNGNFSYQPRTNFNGSDNFTYTIRDSRGATATSTVNVTVNSVNDAPIARNDSLTINEDAAATPINILVNDTDVDGDALTVINFTEATKGTLLFENGAFSYQPNANANGTDSFTYTIDDGQGGSASATVNITIRSLNDAPLAVNDSLTLDEDTLGRVNVIANDTDADNTFSVLSFTQAARGTVRNLGNGNFSYQPLTNFNGSDSFTYTIRDAAGATANAMVSVGVNSINDAPIARNDTLSINEDAAVTLINVIANDTDVDRDPLTIVSFTDAGKGTLIDNANGTFSYQPNANANGTDSFTYIIDDGQGGSASATVNITIRSLNDAPLAVNDALTLDEDTTGTINVIANDTDADNTFSVLSFTQAARGTVRNLGNGNFSYQPLTNFNGSDSFTYTIRDAAGATATATVSVGVNSINDAPIARNDSRTINEDNAAILINVIANDTDVDRDPLTIVSFTDATRGTLTDNANGTFSYQPNANANGTDSFTYIIDDGQGGSASATVNIIITSINDAPLAVNDSLTLDEDTTGSINVIANDTDADSTFSVLSFTQAARGTVRNLSNGNFSYQPLTNFNGSDSFTYTIRDAAGATATATVSVGVNSINDAPIARNDSRTINEDNAAILINVIANDTDVDRDPLTIVSFTDATRGTLTDNANGTFSYQPNANANGTDSFTYIIDDGQGGSASATVNIIITSINDAPLAVNDSLTLDEDTTGSINVIANDTDADSTFSVLSFTQAARGTVRNLSNGNFSYQPLTNFNGSDSFTYTIRDAAGATATATVSVGVNSINDAPIARNDTLSLNEDAAVTPINILANDTDADGDTLTVISFTETTKGALTFNNGAFSYQPNANANGTDSFTYIIDDGQGGSASATVNIVIRSLNDAPLAVNDELTLDEDTTGSINVIANDTDGDGDPITLFSFSQAARGVVRNNNGTITYTPNANTNGTDSFTYSITDGRGGTSTGTVNVTITPLNDAPLAVNDSVTTNEDTPATFNVFTNDTDVDGDSLIVINFTDPGKGSVTSTGNGSFTYTPNANANGSDSFIYIVNDANGGTAAATVNININPINDLPIAVNDSVTTSEDTTVTTVNVLLNDTDGDGDLLTISSSTQGSNGAVTDNGNGTFSYTPNPNFSGTDSFTYTISDSSGGTATATVNVAIAAVNDLPITGTDYFIVGEGVSRPISDANLLANDFDDDDLQSSLRIIGLASSPTNGSITRTNTGFNYTPRANFNGNDSFSYIVRDAQGGTSTGTVNLVVARDVDSRSSYSLNPDSNIENATTIPHASILNVAGDGTFDYYAFTAGGSTAILDIDFGAKPTGSIDTELFLFDQTGALVTRNDNASTALGAGGSTSGFDAYIKASNLTAGQLYIVGVAQSGAGFSGGQIFGNPPNSGQTYTLHISVEGHPTSAF
uniref:tandem-95 repeat protein n=1 Tax=Trichocoleus desertorum TaxID=1481672 RepID=UPI0025B4363B|nr:tandem-95 repeat protein [Trichocoleus desertorum]